uniref:Uncharacterized protein n=1 Tax=Tanacetum cinerariifolium TaxID=118510 RepID=A0A6L2N2B3_TANCI|nr:hypothetical protein [Tanacetum cinerariifolium]
MGGTCNKRIDAIVAMLLLLGPRAVPACTTLPNSHCLTHANHHRRNATTATITTSSPPSSLVSSSSPSPRHCHQRHTITPHVTTPTTSPSSPPPLPSLSPRQDLHKAVVGFYEPCVLGKQKKVDPITMSPLSMTAAGRYGFIFLELNLRDVTFSEDFLYGAKAVTDFGNLTKPNQNDQVVLEDSLRNLANKSIVAEHKLSLEITQSPGESSDTSEGSKNNRSFEDSGRSNEEDSEDGAFSEEGGFKTP